MLVCGRCGYSAGNVMANFYDGTQCVSSTFIVAMAASAGGALFILCLILMCIINKQRDAIELAKQAVSKSVLSLEDVSFIVAICSARCHQVIRETYSLQVAAADWFI